MMGLGAAKTLVDLRQLQAAINRYLKPGFTPLPLDGKNSPKLNDDLTAAILQIKANLAGPQDETWIDLWLTQKATKVGPTGIIDDSWLASQTTTLITLLNENGDMLDLPPAEKPSAPGLPKVPNWVYATLGGMVVLAIIGGRSIARIRAEAANPPQ